MGIRRDRLPVVVVGALGFAVWALPGVFSQNWTLAWQLPAGVLTVVCVLYTAQKALAYVLGTEEEEAKG